MTYDVRITDAFNADLDQHLQWLVDEKVSKFTIDRWFGKVYDQILRLDRMPYRHPVASIDFEGVGIEARKMNIGDHLIFYVVDEAEKTVDVVAFRRGATRE